MNLTSPERFWKRVQITTQDECWPWIGRRCKGYGYVGFEGRTQPAHRIAYIFYFGDFDRSLDVMHKCDNPPCCNPHHLILGTHSDNMLDAINKGRLVQKKGEEHWKVILTEKDVRRIRELWLPGYGNAARLAREYGVSNGCIWMILTNRNWRHLK